MGTFIKEITATDGSKAVIKKHGKDYSLTITSRNIGRNRWGTLKEIEQDADFFVRTGTLLTSGERW